MILVRCFVIMTTMLSKNAIAAVVAEAKLSPGLVYLSSLEAGIKRKRGKNGFLYYAPDGGRLTDRDEIARLNRLAIPPAYRDVIISPDARSHLQAVGIDARGRKQYRYHPEWQAERERAKFGWPTLACGFPIFARAWTRTCVRAG